MLSHISSMHSSAKERMWRISIANVILFSLLDKKEVEKVLERLRFYAFM